MKENVKPKQEHVETKKSNNYPFIFALVSASAAILFIILSIYSNYSVLMVNTSALQQVLSSINVSTQSQLLIETGVSALKSALMLILPLLLISGVLLFILAFGYLNSKMKDKRMMGGLMTIIITLIPILGLFIFLPISPLIVVTDISYLGVFGSFLSFSIYILFMIFFIFGIASGAIEIYKEGR